MPVVDKEPYSSFVANETKLWIRGFPDLGPLKVLSLPESNTKCRHIMVAKRTTMIITDLEFRDGEVNSNIKFGAAVYVDDYSVLKATRVNFVTNRAHKRGSAVYLAEGSTFECTRCNFTGNRCRGTLCKSDSSFEYGGAIGGMRSGALLLKQTNFWRNEAGGGKGGAIGITGYYGGMGLIAVRKENGIIIEDSVFKENTGGGKCGSGGSCNNGGAIYVKAMTEIVFTRCTFVRNVATGNSGGAIYVEAVTTDKFEIKNTIFLNNYAAKIGGALALYSGTYSYMDRNKQTFSPTNIINCTFSNNIASAGGAFAIENENFLQGGTPQITHFLSTQFINNTAKTTSSQGGGAIFVQHESRIIPTTIKCEKSSFYSNTANSELGSTIFANTVNVEILSSTIYGTNGSSNDTVIKIVDADVDVYLSKVHAYENLGIDSNLAMTIVNSQFYSNRTVWYSGILSTCSHWSDEKCNRHNLNMYSCGNQYDSKESVLLGISCGCYGEACSLALQPDLPNKEVQNLNNVDTLILGPYNLNEGSASVSYKLRLRPNPVGEVRVCSDIKGTVFSSLTLIVTPACIKIANDEPVTMTLSSPDDLTDAAVLKEDFFIFHYIESSTDIFFPFGNGRIKNASVIARVYDQNNAGLRIFQDQAKDSEMGNRTIGTLVYMSFNSKPLSPLLLEPSVTSTDYNVQFLEENGDRRDGNFLFSPTVWTPAFYMKMIVTAANPCPSATTAEIVMTIKTHDINYMKFNGSKETVVVLSVTKAPLITNVEKRSNSLQLKWDSAAAPTMFHIQYSKTRDFESSDVKTEVLPGTAREFQISTLHPELQVWYFRISAYDYLIADTGDWSVVSPFWTTANDCSSEEYLDDLSVSLEMWECIKCPDGSSCDGPVRWTGVKAMFGMWRVPWKKRLDPELFLPCLRPLSCLGSANAKFYASIDTETKKNSKVDNNETCSDFHTGILCAECKVGAWRDSNYKCNECIQDKGLHIAFLSVLITVSLAIICFVVYGTIRKGGKGRSIEIQIARISLNHFVIAAAAATFPLEWPSEILSLFHTMSFVSGDAVGSGFNICFQDASSFRPVQLWGIIVALVIPLVLLLWVLFWNVLKLKTRNDAYIKAHLPTSVLATLFLLYPIPTKAAFKLIACRSVAGRLYLEADFGVACDSAEYLFWVLVLGIPIIVVYTLGIPLFYFFAMWKHVKAVPQEVNSNTSSESDRASRRASSRGNLRQYKMIYGYLFSGYRAEAWWWELWNTLRKAIFSGCSVLLHPAGVEMQSWTGLVLLSVFISVFILGKPYTDDNLNRLEITALVTDFVTLLFGLGLFNNANNTKSNEFAQIISIIIVILNVLYVFYVLNMLRKYSDKGTCTRLRQISSGFGDKYAYYH
eukprot:g13611.t1